MKKKLPEYFRKDDVGGLSHLLGLMDKARALGDLKQFFNTLKSEYGEKHARYIMTGLGILLVPDRRKLQRLEETSPGAAELNERESQRYLSSLIYAVSVSLISNDELARLLLKGDHMRARALDYMKALLLDAAECATIVTPIDFSKCKDDMSKARMVADAVDTLFLPYGRNMTLAVGEFEILRGYLHSLLPCDSEPLDSAIRSLWKSIGELSRFAYSMSHGQIEDQYLDEGLRYFREWKAKYARL